MTTPRTAATRPTSTIVSLVALAAFLIASADTARAQSGTAQISGVVHDQQGGVLPGVTVALRNQDTGVARTAVSEADGRYRFPALAPGLYTLRAELSGFATMTFNLLRFVAWQNIVLVPLALLAWPAVRRGDGIARPLAAGLLLTLAAMLVLLPWQGLGWGYRYWHGLIGSLCLLAGYGWISVAAEARRRHFVLVVGTAVSLVAMVPIQLAFAHDYAAPRARAYALIASADADVVLVVPAEDLFDDLVRNAPDLSNRPKVMDLRRLDAIRVRALCRRYRVALFDIRHGARVGLPSNASRCPCADPQYVLASAGGAAPIQGNRSASSAPAVR